MNILSSPPEVERGIKLSGVSFKDGFLLKTYVEKTAIYLKYARQLSTQCDLMLTDICQSAYTTQYLLLILTLFERVRARKIPAKSHSRSSHCLLNIPQAICNTIVPEKSLTHRSLHMIWTALHITFPHKHLHVREVDYYTHISQSLIL